MTKNIRIIKKQRYEWKCQRENFGGLRLKTPIKGGQVPQRKKQVSKGNNNRC